MNIYDIENKEIFSLLTSKQISEISEAAIVKEFEAGQFVFGQGDQAKNLFIILEGEVSLRVPGRNSTSIDSLDLVIEDINQTGTFFGTNLLFDVKQYITSAIVLKPSKIMILDAENFLEIIRKNGSEFIVMTYLARVYFHRYMSAMNEFKECVHQAR